MPIGVYMRSEVQLKTLRTINIGRSPWNKGKHTGILPTVCFKAGKEHLYWKGGRRKNKNGYILIYQPNHPFARANCIFEHRLVMEKILKRFLMPQERVHHINGIRDDNKEENLKFFPNESEHMKFHYKKGGGNFKEGCRHAKIITNGEAGRKRWKIKN